MLENRLQVRDQNVVQASKKTKYEEKEGHDGQGAAVAHWLGGGRDSMRLRAGAGHS